MAQGRSSSQREDLEGEPVRFGTGYRCPCGEDMFEVSGKSVGMNGVMVELGCEAGHRWMLWHHVGDTEQWKRLEDQEPAPGG